MSPQIIEFMRKLDVKEVHGYRAEMGLAGFTDEALQRNAGELTANMAGEIRPAAHPELH